MSLRITGTGQRLTRFTNLPTSYASFTITGFAKLLVAHPTYNAHLLYTQTATVNGQNHSTIVALEGPTGREIKASDSWGANQSFIITQVPVGGATGENWFYFALVGRGTGAEGHELWYSRTVDSGNFALFFNTPGSGFPMERLDVGSAIWPPGQWGVEDWWFDGLFAHLTVYSRALSYEEIVAQVGRATPASTTGLLSYHSFDGASVAAILAPQQGSGTFVQSSPSPSVSADMPSFAPPTPVIQGGDTLPSTSSALAASAVCSSGATVSLTVGARLAASSLAAAAPTVTLTNSIRFAAAVTTSALTSAALTTSIRFAASATASASGFSGFTSGVLFGAAASASATSSAELTTSVRLAATRTAFATGDVAFVTSVQFSASSVNSAFVFASMQVGARLAATSVSTVAPIVALTNSIQFNAVATASATRSAALTSEIRLAAQVTGFASGLASFVAETRFSAVSLCSATTSVALTNQPRLAASVTATAVGAAVFTSTSEFNAIVTATNVAAASLATSVTLFTSVTSTAAALVQLVSAPTSTAPPMSVYQGTSNSFKSELLRGIHNFTPGTGDTFKMALYTGSASLGPNTTVYTTQSETSGPGYVAGGIVLIPTVLEVQGVGIVDFADADFGIVSLNYRYALIYNSTKANRAVAVFDFGGTFTVADGNLTLQMPPPTPTNAAIRIV